jgi:2-phosphoglycerate kinase
MARMVTKRDGSKQEFIQEKIVVSAIKSGASPDVARRIAKEVETELTPEGSTNDIRRNVLQKLARENKQWEQDWRMYDRAVKRREE